MLPQYSHSNSSNMMVSTKSLTAAFFSLLLCTWMVGCIVLHLYNSGRHDDCLSLTNDNSWWIFKSACGEQNPTDRPSAQSPRLAIPGVQLSGFDCIWHAAFT